MKHCIHCGKPIKETEAFCKNCGHKVNNTSTEQQIGSNDIKPTQPKVQKAKKPVSKKTKILIGSLITVIILLFAAYKTLEYLNRPSELVDSFNKALNEKEIKTLNTYLKKADTDIKIDEKETKKFIDYLYENPDELSELKRALKSDAKRLDNKEHLKTNSEQMLNVKKQGKKWLIFDNYVIQPKAIYLELSADVDNVTVSFEGEPDKKLKETNKQYTIGPFLPYEYTVNAVNKTDYATVEKKETKDPISDLSGKYITFDFEIEGDYVQIYTDYDDATIFINGKDTGVTVEDNDIIQPIEDNGSMRIHLERDSSGEKLKSNAVTINSSVANGYLEINFDSDNDDYGFNDDDDVDENSDDQDNVAYKEDIKDVINQHYQDIKNRDFQSAYQYFSEQKRSEITVDEWKKGYPAYIYENTTDIQDIKLTDDTHAIANMKLYSHSEEDGTETEDTFSGHLEFVKENGTWKLAKSKLEKE